MKKTTKYVIGGTALAALAVGAVVYTMKQNKQAPVPSAPVLGPTNVLHKGRAYTFAAMTPANITTSSDLMNALIGAGWCSGVTINFFNGQGDSGQFPINASGYVASGVWCGADGTAVPAGVVAVQTS